ncbi:MAG: methionyl-tRNA formyltransferase [Acholeplasmatales bacterium]|nr:methionyl-tRNA formyltransferase [Acholeplasmatales bacterium]
MKIVFMGTPEFSVPILEELNNKYEILLVISQPNRVKKKGVFIDTPVAKCAKELGLNLIQPEKINNDYELIKSVGADVLITAAYGQYVPTKILDLFKFKLNVHASLLPKRRGGAPIQRSLIEGDKVTGVSIMEMTKGLDQGCVYGVKEYVIDDNDNSTTLFSKLSIIGRDLLINIIEDIYNGKILGIKQDDNLATFSKNILPEEEKINIDDTSINIRNKVRGLAMEPGAYIEYNDIKLKVYEVSIIDYEGNEKPGTILSTKKGIKIKTLDGAISLDMVLYPGKKITSGKDFSNGQKLFKDGDII